MVRASRRFASLGFIMMTANTSEQYPRLAIEAGASFFLTKPFRMASLKAAMDATLGEAPVRAQARLGAAPVAGRDRPGGAPAGAVAGVAQTTPDRDRRQYECGIRQDIRRGEFILVKPSGGDC
jgi:DNA-binding response OmpR family regulator